MSTDRKLLEDAAKAAGIVLVFPHDPATYGPVDGVPPRRNDTWENWNPLTDDGDALRLAVKRRFRVCIFSARDGDIKTPGFVEVRQEMDDDPLHVEYVDDANYEAATRRAIVRAAAAIGAAK